MTPDELAAHLTARIPGSTSSRAYDELVLDVPFQGWVEAATLIATDPEVDCTFFDWLSAVDEQEDGFAVVAHLYSVAHRHRLRVRTRVPRDAPTVPTLTGLYAGANWHERETAEMFGLIFSGHPNPVSLLLPDSFEGNPLRKEFVLASRVVKRWPGAVEPGESSADVTSRRPTLPPGVPEAGTWPVPPAEEASDG